MNLDITGGVGGAVQQKVQATDQIDAQRKNKDKAADSPQSSTAEKGIQPEELISQIKALTEEGLYSIRFEQNDNADLIVKIFDQKTDELVSQIPAEELLNLAKALEDLRGNIVDTKA
jgi:flagellar protein FlaG